MEVAESLPQIGQIITPCRRSMDGSNSPEFEFCSSFSPPDLLHADELFSGGIILPLHHLRLSSDIPTVGKNPDSSGSDQDRPELEDPSMESSQMAPGALGVMSFSRRWSDIFRRNEKKIPLASVNIDAGDLISAKKKGTIVSNFKEKRRGKKKNGGGGSGVPSAELNINIWPFSRSRSAGNGAYRTRTPAAFRMSNSAPCSRSNSGGESKSRRLPSSSGHGVLVGGNIPVCQVRRGRRSFGEVIRKEGSEGCRKVPPPVPGIGVGRSRSKPLRLNIPICIGYKQQSSCRNDGSAAAGEGARRNSSISIKSLLTKKVH